MNYLPTSWQDEALARDGVSREVPCSALKGETVPDSLPAGAAATALGPRAAGRAGALPGAGGVAGPRAAAAGRGPDNHDGVITDLEPDILECEVKWALE